MALSQEIEEESLITLTDHYKKKLNPKKAKLLKVINALTASRDVRLSAQSNDVIKLVGEQLEKPFNESSVLNAADSIYSMIIEQMDRETEENRRRYAANSGYAQKHIHLRSLRDQLQDHDMTLLMPQSHGNIEVLAIVNRFDQGSIEAVQEGLALALKNKHFNHIFIPIGPGHWRGFYLTKPVDGGKYQLELFDPYGPSGAAAIKGISLNLLKKCRINEDQITIKLTGPLIPQQDGYACGDFTCAYSHKKMKELGARKTAYNQEIITVLDSDGNHNDSLRHAIREVSKASSGPKQIAKQEQYTDREKREFLTRLGQICSDPDKIDKAVLNRKIAKIESISGTKSQYASLRELDAYGVFNSDGSVNTAVADQYGITFDESQIKTRLKSTRFNRLSAREMLIFESVIGTVEQEYVSSQQPSKGLAIACFADFWPSNTFKLLKNHLSMELTGPARQMLGGGYFKFNDTNISISPGPNSARSLTDPEHPELYEEQHDIAGYLDNLLKNNVAHVFAMGRVLPYYPQEGFDKRLIVKREIIDDFINYFIPDVNGRVRLPDIPELKGIHITSRPIQKIGRFITYEISINGHNPIQVHHFPIRDKQPLELTPEELAYVKKVAQTTPHEQNVHTHCRGGKGRSAQIAYLLASLNPKYGQFKHEPRLAQIRAEKTPADEPKYFIETPLQEGYIEEVGYSIQKDLSSEAALEDEDSEIYFIYGTLLKQEIDKHLQEINLPKKVLVKDEEKNLLELMEKYQELSSIPLHQLNDWVEQVCQNPIITESTKKSLTSIHSATDFLLHAFKAYRNLSELELFFDLQARHGGYQDILDRLASLTLEITRDIEIRVDQGFITLQDAQIEQSRLERNESLFVARLQDAYLKNWENITEEDKIACKVEASANISGAITGILEALIHHDPKTFTKEEFNNLQKEYYRCKQRLELLEEAERHDDYQVVDAELKQRTKVAEQLFLLGYDYFEVEPASIIVKMNLLYQRLSELSAANKLSQEKWNELKAQFTAFKIVFDVTKPVEMVPPAIFSTLDKLFQEKREQIKTLPELLKVEVLQEKPRGESLDEFVAGLGFALLEAASEKLPQEYYGDEANGFYAKEINQLLNVISQLADSYKKPAENEIINLHQPREIPAAEEYEAVRQQVIELIAQHVPPFLVTTTDLRVQPESPKVSDLEKKDKPLLDPSIERHRESMDNALRIKAMRDAAVSAKAREIQDKVDDLSSRIEEKVPKKIQYPKQPKLIVFDLEDTLLDLNTNELKRAEELINVLKYAKKHGIEVALIADRTPSQDAEEPISIAKLKTMIHDATGIDIANVLTFLDTESLHQEKQTLLSYFPEKASRLEQEIRILRNQIPEAENKKELEETIEKLQLEIASLPKRSNRLTSGKFIQLDSIGRHFQELKNLNLYYHMVEDKILQDFKNPELTKNIGINDFIEKKELWDDLFNLAEVLMESDSLKDPKPSLHTLLKDLIFDADKAQLLQRKYGALQPQEEVRRRRVNENKRYFIEHLPQIESFYQGRLAVHKYRYEKKAALKEEDILFLDDQQNIITETQQQSNYRAIKVCDFTEDSFRYMVEFNYEMGVYNGVIAYFNGDKENAPKNYGPGSINKTLAPYLSNIPNFTTHEFQHSPIVLHAPMSKIFEKLGGLSHEEAAQKRYKEQFFKAALERYHQLPKELQDDFVTTYYGEAHQALEAINQKLRELVTSPPEDSAQLREELTKLKAQADRIIKMDEQFSQRISPTFLSSEAKRFRAIIVGCIFSGNLDSLKIVTNEMDELDKVQLKNDDDITLIYMESMKQKPDVYQHDIHPALKAMDVFNQEFIAEQYTHLVSKQLKELIDVYIGKNDPFSILNAQVLERKYPSLQSLLEILQDDLNNIELDANDSLVQIRSQLIAAQKLCEALAHIVPYQNRANNLNGQPEVDYYQQIFALSEQITGHKKTIESSAPYQAKLFLDKAERYLLAKDWNVGFQWNKHVEKVRGKDKKVPATVAEQLKVIRQARTDGDYEGAKEKFLQIGQKKEISWNSSKVARNYYSLFKKEDVDLAKDLDKEFLPTKKP